MKININEVIEEIIDLRVKKGYSSTSIVKYLKYTYDINQSRAYELIREARELLGEIYLKVNETALEESIMLLENMREQEIRNTNNKLALEIQKELNKINQLYIKKIDITSGGEKIIININKQDE